MADQGPSALCRTDDENEYQRCSEVTYGPFVKLSIGKGCQEIFLLLRSDFQSRFHAFCSDPRSNQFDTQITPNRACCPCQCLKGDRSIARREEPVESSA